MKMMDDDNIGKEGPEHFTEHGDEEGVELSSPIPPNHRIIYLSTLV